MDIWKVHGLPHSQTDPDDDDHPVPFWRCLIGVLFMDANGMMIFFKTPIFLGWVKQA